MVVIGAADIVSQIRKRFGNRGTTDLLLQETIQPVSNVADLDGPPFHGKGSFIAGVQQAAVAGQVGYITAFLDFAVAPLQARTVVRRIFLVNDNAGATSFSIGLINDPNLIGSGVKAALTSSSTVVRGWDTVPAMVAADQLLATTRLAFGTSATVVVLSNPLRITLLPNTTLTIEGPWCLAPGNHLVVMGNTVNQIVTASFYGDEYLLG